jgi:hypothetical protein
MHAEQEPLTRDTAERQQRHDLGFRLDALGALIHTILLLTGTG